MPMLKIDNIEVFYGDVQALRGVTLDVKEGELVSVIGANGAGKTTLLKTISGLLRPAVGHIMFKESKISEMNCDHIVEQGVVQVPEGRLLFPRMTVRENLEMGAFLQRDQQQIQESFEEVFKLFPVLEERSKQLAMTLSGGEQQMVAIGRALMASPQLILFDEPSLGLAPKLVDDVFETVLHVNKQLGMTVLLVEQNVQRSCEISDRGFVMENGTVVLQGTGDELLDNEHVRQAYLGV